MKYKSIVSAVIIMGTSAFADVILHDPFDNGDLATYTNGVNGGFTIHQTGGTPGIAEEDSGVARISNAPDGQNFGILSTNTVSLGGAAELKTTWVITDSDLKNNAKALVFVWQTESALNTVNPALGLILHLDDELAYFTTNGTPIVSDSLSSSFGQSNDTFVVTANFDLTGGMIEGDDTLEKSGGGALNLASPWSGGTPSLNNLRVGAFAQGKGNNAMVIEFDSVTVETIPEPAVVSLIAMAGGGMIFYRRLSKRHKALTDT